MTAHEQHLRSQLATWDAIVADYARRKKPLAVGGVGVEGEALRWAIGEIDKMRTETKMRAETKTLTQEAINQPERHTIMELHIIRVNTEHGRAWWLYREDSNVFKGKPKETLQSVRYRHAQKYKIPPGMSVVKYTGLHRPSEAAMTIASLERELKKKDRTAATITAKQGDS